MSAIKKAFSEYYTKLENLYKKFDNSLPTVPYTETLNKALIIGSPDEDGEIQWRPKDQESKFKWSIVETKIGFVICQELKDYYNSIFFFALSGIFTGCELHFYRIDGSESLEKIVLRNYSDAQYVFPDTELFLIGNAKVNDDDNYFIYFDNSTGKLFCYESDKKTEVLLSYSLAKTIGDMEAIL